MVSTCHHLRWLIKNTDDPSCEKKTTICDLEAKWEEMIELQVVVSFGIFGWNFGASVKGECCVTPLRPFEPWRFELESIMFFVLFLLVGCPIRQLSLTFDEGFEGVLRGEMGGESLSMLAVLLAQILIPIWNLFLRTHFLCSPLSIAMIFIRHLNDMSLRSLRDSRLGRVGINEKDANISFMSSVQFYAHTLKWHANAQQAAFCLSYFEAKGGVRHSQVASQTEMMQASRGNILCRFIRWLTSLFHPGFFWKGLFFQKASQRRPTDLSTFWSSSLSSSYAKHDRWLCLQWDNSAPSLHYRFSCRNLRI